MAKRTFPGGVHPEEKKELTCKESIKRLEHPTQVIVSMQQSIGWMAKPLVKKGDSVLKGQLLGEKDGSISARVHAPVSGTVVALEERPTLKGRQSLCVVIENDGQENWVERTPCSDPWRYSAGEIRSLVDAAGIVGLGGAAFPTSVKLSLPSQARIDYFILNGCECEPYLTADYRLLLESPEDVVLGTKLLAKACGAGSVVIGVEDNKEDAIAALRRVAGNISVVSLETKYPQGGERQLIKALTKRDVPRNGLPYMAGVLVNNVGTAFAVAQALRDGTPLIERVVTVTGAVNKPQNFLVPIGVTFRELIEKAGGFKGEPGKVLAGGPMTGLAQGNLEVPVEKGTCGVVVLEKGEKSAQEPGPCIKCARCVDVCPAYLLPLRLEALTMKGLWDEALEYGALDCIECGCCTYICPSKRYLLHYIRLAKHQILLARSKQGD